MAKQQRPRGFNRRSFGFILILLLLATGITLLITRTRNKADRLAYKDLVTVIEEGRIVANRPLVYAPVGSGANSSLMQIKGRYVNSEGKERNFVIILDQRHFDELTGLVDDSTGIQFEVRAINEINWLSLIISVGLPIGAIIFLFFLMRRSANVGNDQAFQFGRSRARLSTKSKTTFADVAGAKEEKEEMQELIDFLKNPKKYRDMGAKIPRGVLLVGPPGTGKTLIARAVAGEANVPFYTISGSEFVEMFVGVGASRVRDMFKTAKENAPCLLFIDEIDAVGRQRGAGLGGGHDEREQTLNQLLVEMDGFEDNSGVIVVAATNRPDVLDPALLRPGRFDRTITMSNPDVAGREEILKVHARNKRISPKVNFEDIAKRTPGFSGADLANLLNEAALLAARENKKEIKIYHIDEAIDRVIMGPAKRSRKYQPDEKMAIAYHEAGHAVIGLKLQSAEIVQKVTIVPRGQAGGYSMSTPEKEKFLQTKTELLDVIAGYLGGRVAEELMVGDISTGAYSDIERATEIARAMVTEYGMSALGPIQYEKKRGSVFLGRDYMTDKNFSDTVAHEIDKEVRKIIDEAYQRARETLTEHKALLQLMAEHLYDIETLTKEDIYELADTGKIEWWEKKKAKQRAEQEAREKEAELQEIYESTLKKMQDAKAEEPSSADQPAESKPSEDDQSDAS